MMSKTALFMLWSLLLGAFVAGDDNPCDNIMYEQFGDFCYRVSLTDVMLNSSGLDVLLPGESLPGATNLLRRQRIPPFRSWTYGALRSLHLRFPDWLQRTRWKHSHRPHVLWLNENVLLGRHVALRLRTIRKRQNPEGISCVEMLSSDIDWNFRLGECDSFETTFACVLPDTKDSALACPDQFNAVEGRCLRFFFAMTTHAGAEEQCEAAYAGAHLASIHSKRKTADIQKELDGAWYQIHVGLSKAKGGDYAWSDGSAYDYKNWATAFPDARLGNCVGMETNPTSNGVWKNIPCVQKLSFFCELPASVVPTKSPLDFQPTSDDNNCPSNSNFHDGGYVTSPGYPAITTGNICDYHLSTPRGTKVSLKFLDFSMCYPQYVQIYDGPDTSNKTKILAELTYYSSAAELSKIYTSSGNLMTVHYDFHNLECDNAGRGFVFQFEAQKKK